MIFSNSLSTADHVRRSMFATNTGQVIVLSFHGNHRGITKKIAVQKLRTREAELNQVVVNSVKRSSELCCRI